jgi:hypothetical protein
MASQLRSIGKNRFSLDSKCQDLSDSSSSVLPKDNLALLTRLQSNLGTPKAPSAKTSFTELHIHNQRARRLSISTKTLSKASTSHTIKRYPKESSHTRLKQTESNESLGLRLKVAELEGVIDDLQRLLMEARCDNSRLLTEKLLAETACKDVYLLLTANTMGANQKAVGRLRQVLKQTTTQANSSSSRLRTYLLLDEEPRLDEHIRIKSKTTSNQARGKKQKPQPYTLSPGGGLRPSSRAKQFSSPINSRLATASKTKPRSHSNSRSSSPLSHLSTQEKLEFIKDKTQTLLEAWRRCSRTAN